jgi:exopolysaccharide biosynthesis polyprenyl glycosylphosphotransferase
MWPEAVGGAERTRPSLWQSLYNAMLPKSRGRDVRNVLIIGAGKLGRKLADQLGQDPLKKRLVQGFLDDTEPLGVEVRGRVSDLPRVARSEFIDEIIVTVPVEREVAHRVIRQAQRNRIDITVVPDLFGFDPNTVTFERYGGVPVLTLCQEKIPAIGLGIKRLLDALLSALALVLAIPLLAAVAAAIKLDSAGPVLYPATRVGFKGKRFLCFKFRTMRAGANHLRETLRADNEREGPLFKIVRDPRVTRVGRFLRRYSLDELPQLWNVLKGEMSLVGPRPHPIDDFERYKLEDLQRLEVTPGLTGLWQVTARRDPSFARNMELDREYIEQWSLGGDLRILYKTIFEVAKGDGA